MVLWVTFLAAATAAASAGADQISALGRNYPGAQIVTLIAGRLEVRTAEGHTMHLPLADVEWLIVDRAVQFDDLNEAERLMLAGDPQRAVSRYERASRVASGFWSDVVSSRLIRVHDQLGQLDEAMHHLVRLVHSRMSGPAAASRLVPRNLPVQRNARFTRAIRELDGGFTASQTTEQQTLLAWIRFDLLRRSGDKRAGELLIETISRPVPSDIRTPELYAMVTAALDMAAAEGTTTPAVMEALDRAIEGCPDDSLPDLLLLKGRVLLARATTREDVMRASWPFLRVAIHMPKDKRAAQALYLAATALDRLGSVEPARKLLDDCLSRPEISDELRASAEELRGRLKPIQDR